MNCFNFFLKRNLIFLYKKIIINTKSWKCDKSHSNFLPKHRTISTDPYKTVHKDPTPERRHFVKDTKGLFFPTFGTTLIYLIESSLLLSLITLLHTHKLSSIKKNFTHYYCIIHCGCVVLFFNSYWFLEMFIFCCNLNYRRLKRIFVVIVERHTRSHSVLSSKEFVEKKV